MACGIALTNFAELETSPISSFPYVLSLMSSFTVGTGTIAMNAGFMVLQMLLLRMHYDPRQLVQLPAAIVMGLLCDVFFYLLRGLSYSSYFGQWVYCALGIVLVAFGVSVAVTSRVIVMAGDGLAIAISTTLNRAFGPKNGTHSVTARSPWIRASWSSPVCCPLPFSAASKASARAPLLQLSSSASSPSISFAGWNPCRSGSKSHSSALRPIPGQRLSA